MSLSDIYIVNQITTGFVLYTYYMAIGLCSGHSGSDEDVDVVDDATKV